MLLHTFTITPNNSKVVAFIQHFDLDVEIHQISFKHSEQKTPEFLAMNPMGRVPVLVDGDLNLWEGNAILTYLASKFPETNTLPTDPAGRADVDRWLHWQSSHLMPTMVALRTGDEQRMGTLDELVGVLDAQLDGKDYLLGDLSVVDFAIGAFLMTKDKRKFDYEPFPNAGAWIERVGNLKGFAELDPKGPPG